MRERPSRRALECPICLQTICRGFSPATAERVLVAPDPSLPAVFR